PPALATLSGPPSRSASAEVFPTPHMPPAPCTPAASPLNVFAALPPQDPPAPQQPCNTPPTAYPPAYPPARSPPPAELPHVRARQLRFRPARYESLGSSPDHPHAL